MQASELRRRGDPTGHLGFGGALHLAPSPRITVLDTEELQTFHIDIPQHILDATVQRYVR